MSREWRNDDPSARLAGFVREQDGAAPWSKVKGWIATGKVFVHDIKKDKVKSFDARNGHIEMDVDFAQRLEELAV